MSASISSTDPEEGLAFFMGGVRNSATAKVAVLTARPADLEAVASACEALAFMTNQAQLAPMVADAGGIPALVSIIAEHGRSAQLVSFAAFSLANIGRALPRCAASMIELGGMRVAIEALRTLSRATSDKTTRVAAHNLAAWIVEMHQAASAAAIAQLVDAGGATVLVAALRALTDSEPFAIIGCRLLTSVCFTPGQSNVIVRDGVVSVLMSLLDRHRGPAAARLRGEAFDVAAGTIVNAPDVTGELWPLVQRIAGALKIRGPGAITDAVMGAFRCVGSYAMQTPQTTAAAAAIKAIVEGGGASGVAAIVRASTGGDFETACSTLAEMARHDPPTVAAAGALETCISELLSRPADPIAIGKLLWLAYRLAAHESTARQLVDRGLLTMLSRAHREHPEHASLVNRACMVLTTVARHESLRQRAFKAGAVTLALSALRRHRDNVDVAMNACYALEAVVYNILQARASFHAARGASAIADAWTAHPHSEPLAAAASGALMLLQTRVSGPSSMDALRVFELAVSALCEHYQQPALGNLAGLLLAAELPQTAQWAANNRSVATVLVQVLRMYAANPSMHVTQPQTPAGLLRTLGCGVHHNGELSRLDPALSPQSRYFNAAGHSSFVAPCISGGVVPTLLPALLSLRALFPGMRCWCAAYAFVNVLAAHRVVWPMFAACPAVVQSLVDTAADSKHVCIGCRCYTLATLSRLAADDSLACMIVDDGIVASLMQLLDVAHEPHAVLQMMALTVVVRLSRTDAGRAAGIEASGVQVLTTLLRTMLSASAKGPVAASCTIGRAVAIDSAAARLSLAVDSLRALANSMRSPEGHAAARRARLPDALVAPLLADRTDGLRTAGCAALRAFAMGHGGDSYVVAAGGIPMLVCVAAATTSGPGTVEQACGALWNALRGGDARARRDAQASDADKLLPHIVAKHGLDSPAGQMAAGALACLQ